MHYIMFAFGLEKREGERMVITCGVLFLLRRHVGSNHMTSWFILKFRRDDALWDCIKEIGLSVRGTSKDVLEI